MYIPESFRIADHDRLVRFIEANAFGMLISAADGIPAVSHIPFIVLDRGERLKLGLHLAKANPHWRNLDGAEVLAVFRGAHGFISASWYTDPQHSVPTWNYSAVHCAGRAHVVGPEQTKHILREMVHTFEGPQGWAIDDADAAYVARMENGIVGIAIDVTSIEGKFKFSQNRSSEDRGNVLDRLEASCPELAKEMSASSVDGGKQPS